MKKHRAFNAAVLITYALSASPAYSMVTAPGTIRIDFRMSTYERNQLRLPVKIEVPSVEMRVFENGKRTTKTAVRIHSRGAGSIKYARKNLEIETIDSSAEGKDRKIDVGDITSDNIIFSAAPEDLLVTKNMIVYRLYSAVGIATVDTDYAEVTLNGSSQGLHMVTKDPVKYAMKNENALVVLRRGYNDFIEVKKADRGLTPAEVAAYQTEMQQIYKMLSSKRGEKLYDAISEKVNLKSYMRWLAVNFLVKNGDYIDELFFLGKKTDDGHIYFEIMPWDLDNSFASRMHSASIPLYSNNGLSKRSEDQMLFSFESRLDQAISQDPYLLSKYFEELESVTQILTEKKITSVFSEVKSKLAPYIHDEDIQEAGLLDFGNAKNTPESVEADLDGKLATLIATRSAVQAELAEIKTESSSRAMKIGWLRKFAGFLEQRVFLHFAK